MSLNKSYLKLKRCYILTVLLVLNSHFIFSQLTITGNNAAMLLAQNIIGNGITIKNATLNCGSNAAGTFTYSGSNLGLNNGIVLTTGYAPGAANPGAYFCNVINGNNFTDPDVTAISSRANYDVCILNFDFVPLCDTLRISYVFGSEEYPQYLHQMYNDVFGMFLTGQNPAGGNYSAKNIATLPNGYTPVSIDSVNEGSSSVGASHPEFYHDNFTHPNNEIAYNGYTIPITSKAALIACNTYHMKIAIADGANGHNDSGVFIKGNSFTCNNVPVVTSNTVFSCSDKGKINVAIGNYAGTPSYTWYPGGEHADSLINLSSGTYTCLINLPGICSNYTVTATIPASSSMTIDTKDVSICKGHTAQLAVSGANTYTWLPATGLNNGSIAHPIASPSVTTVYTVTGASISGCLSSGTVAVNVSSVNIIADFRASAYETNIDEATIQFYDNSNGAISWVWDFEEPAGSTLKDPTHLFSSPGNYIVHLVVADEYGCSDTTSKTIIVNDIIKDLFTFYVPNAFTPNGDGLNDVFLPEGTGWDITTYKLSVFDRWGQKIFYTQDHSRGWDGTVKGNTETQLGSYIYKAELIDNFKKAHSFSGTITILK